MSFTKIREVISPEVLKDLYPLSAEATAVKTARDEEMKKITGPLGGIPGIF